FLTRVVVEWEPIAVKIDSQLALRFGVSSMRAPRAGKNSCRFSPVSSRLGTSVRTERRGCGRCRDDNVAFDRMRKDETLLLRSSGFDKCAPGGRSGEPLSRIRDF